ncbi:MAG: hypothetical protein MUC64_09965 [Rubritepida sp.]|nr:hypothetical protein [Rubritepida sp.]
MAAPERRCAARAEPFAPQPALAPGTRAALLARGFSPEAAGAAEATGAALPLLRFAALPPAARAERLALRQEALEAILQAMLDAAAVIAEIDCEGERVDELRARLQAMLDRRARQLGVAGLMMGAATAAATGGLALGGLAAAGNIAGIVGGAGEAGFAGALLFGDPPTGTLETRRNLLAEVWAAPAAPRLFPGTVWRHLQGAGASGESRLALLRAEWTTPELLGAPDSPEAEARAALQFGPGGSYTAEALERRDRMLDLLESAIALMHQDLRRLLAELRALAARGPTP